MAEHGNPIEEIISRNRARKNASEEAVASRTAQTDLEKCRLADERFKTFQIAQHAASTLLRMGRSIDETLASHKPGISTKGKKGFLGIGRVEPIHSPGEKTIHAEGWWLATVDNGIYDSEGGISEPNVSGVLLQPNGLVTRYRRNGMILVNYALDLREDIDGDDRVGIIIPFNDLSQSGRLFLSQNPNMQTRLKHEAFIQDRIADLII